MRILLTCDAIGGVWNHAIDLTRGLVERGHEVVLVPMGPMDAPARLAAARESGALSVHPIPGALEWMPEPWDDVDAAARQIARLASELDVDLIHLNSYAHAAADHPCPVVVGAHSSLHGWWHAVRRGPAPGRWETYRERVRAGLSAADVVVAPTQAMLDELSVHYAPLADKGRVVPNGRDPGPILAAARARQEAEREREAAALHRRPVRDDGRLGPRSTKVPGAMIAHVGGTTWQYPRAYDVPKERQVLWSGRTWDEGNGLATLDAAAANGLAWPVRVAGPEKAPDGSRVRTTHLDRLGTLDEQAYAALLAATPVYVSTSLYEPFGLGPLDAAIAGAALVLPDLPTLREVWGTNARFVPPGDADALHAALSVLIRDQWSRRRLAVAAHEHALDNHSVDDMAVGMLDCYASALGVPTTPVEERGHGHEAPNEPPATSSVATTGGRP